MLVRSLGGSVLFPFAMVRRILVSMPSVLLLIWRLLFPHLNLRLFLLSHIYNLVSLL
jgi:hypothetical protein